MANVFTPGDLVISVYGDGAGDGTYADNQASPIVLEQINSTTGAVDPITGTITNGTLVNGELELPQSSLGSNSAISGEYGSSSEGSLELSADGQSLTIAGYGINDATFNNAEASGGSNAYGNPALAQTTSLQGGSSTAVTRVIADINASGTVDTSTALYGVFNTNNPRSVATTDGTSFYVAGQGVKGDTTQGVFYAKDGASGATAINTADDARTVEISNGMLYVSQDSKQGPTANISTFATAKPTAASAETALAGISQSVSVSNGKGNSVNGSSGTVYLSPENYFFANSTTLYVSDSGNPKQNTVKTGSTATAPGVGDGGLQKWSYNGTAWVLDYTLSAGLNLVTDTTADPGAGHDATTGLIGLTGQVVGNTVNLYATNATIGDLDNTYLYSISDNLNATSLPSTESFTKLATAASDTNIRGVAFAPQIAAVACYCTGTLILTARGEVAVQELSISDLVVTASGEHRPVKWIGHRGYIGRFANCNPDVLPICFKAGSLDEGVPSRNLWVSPKHAMFIDGVLIPAEHLVNSVTVVKAERVESVEYWHVELDSHDVLLAEGAPAESFVDDNGRCIFHNAHTFFEMYPDARRAEAVYCAPRVESGFALDAVRRRLAVRAGLPVARGPNYGALRGFIERVEDGVVHGWAQHELRAVLPVCLDVLVDGVVVGLVLAETFRGDLLAAGIGEGRHGFSFALPASASGAVTVRRSVDGAVLPGLAGAAEVRAEPLAA